MKKPKCVILVGLPGCGKSTIRKKFNNFSVISSDDYIEQFSIDNNMTYRDAIKICLNDARKNNNINFDNFVKNNVSFIIDRTNLSLEKRTEIYEKLPSHYDIEIIIINRSNVNRMIVNMFRTLNGRNVPYSEIDDLQRSYVKPFFSEDKRIINIRYIFN